MRRTLPLGLSIAAFAALALAVVACSSPAPAPTPTTAAKAPAPTAAPAAPTPAAAGPTAAAPAPTKAAEATKPAAAAPAVTKPAGFPTKPINFIVPWDAGGSTDVGFRLLAVPWEKALGTTMEMINKPGAGSQVGVTELATAKPDGYTLGNISAPAIITMYLDPERKAAFTFDSFEPIGMHVIDPGAVAVQPDGKYKSVKDLVDDAKANPEKVKVATTGVLGDDHLAIIQLQKMTGAKFAIVHFTGGAPEMTALMGGHVDAIFDNVGTYTANHKANKIKIIGVMDSKRAKAISEVPTFEEQGFKLISSSSRGVAAPKGTPKEVVNFLSATMAQAMADPGVIQKLADAGFVQTPMNPEEFRKYWMDFENQVKPLMDDAKATSK